MEKSILWLAVAGTSIYLGKKLWDRASSRMAVAKLIGGAEQVYGPQAEWSDTVKVKVGRQLNAYLRCIDTGASPSECYPYGDAQA